MKPPLRGKSQDDFQSPPLAIIPLIKYLNQKWVYWEPACGKGNLVKALNTRGFNCFGTDLLTGTSFFDLQPAPYDCIITNPPFSLKDEFLKHAYDLNKPFAFLLPITALETPARQNLFKRFGIEIIFMDKRLHYKSASVTSHRSWFASAWFTWGLDIGSQITFEKVVDDLQPLLSAAKG